VGEASQAKACEGEGEKFNYITPHPPFFANASKGGFSLKGRSVKQSFMYISYFGNTMLLVKRKFRTVSIALLAFSSPFFYTQIKATTTRLPPLYANYTQEEIAEALGWVNKKTICNLCGGYYLAFPIPYVPNPAVTDQAENYNIYADHPEWSLNGTSTLKGNVKVIQPTLELKADLVKIRRDPTTNKIEYLDGFNHVQITQPDLFVIADQGSVNTFNNTMTLNNLYYRMGAATHQTTVTNPATGKTEYHIYNLSARGHADVAHQIKPHVFTFKHATYSMCPPTSNAWKLTGSDVKLDYNTGWGTADNALLYIQKVPIFYFPYYSFPINKTRKTGFLTPGFDDQSSNGFTTIVPYYWNMAPNYDMTITPNIMTKRGILDDNTFRYMTNDTQGLLQANFISDDRVFKQLKSDLNAQYAGQSAYSQQLSELNSDSNTRTDITWQQQTQFNPHWSSGINYSHDNDDYYQSDFGTNMTGANTQLLQMANLNYASDYWNWNGAFQRYQTLHPLAQVAVQNQYQLLPQVNFAAHTPLLMENLNLTDSGQYTYFDITDNPDSNTKLVIGDRSYMDPTAQLNFTQPYGSLTPALTVHTIQYNLKYQPPDTPADPSLIIPMFDTDGKLVFIRNIAPFSQAMEQTLEPEFYYLFVPYKKQTDLPIFDTSAEAFSYDSMFQNNRFSGPDRIGDANQVTLALASRLLDSDTGTEGASVKIADIYYMRNRVVDASCYGPQCTDAVNQNSVNADTLSPIAAQGTYEFNPQWSLEGDWAWNPKQHSTASQTLAFQYHPSKNYLLNLTYYRVDEAAAGVSSTVYHPSIVTNVQPQQNIQEGIISGNAAITSNWSFLGAVDRNWNQVETQSSTSITTINAPTQVYTTFLSGLQYDSCCWAMRVVAYRRYVALNANGNPTFDNGVMYQFSLKGLGTDTFGAKRSTLITDNIQGYQDNFGRIE
jgi:LPS-assembly protein